MMVLRDIMTRDVVYVTPDTPITDVVSILSSEFITGVPVLSSNRVVGVISASDIVEFAGRNETELENGQESWDDIDDEMERELEADMSPADLEAARAQA